MSQPPTIKVIKVHPPKRELHLLARIWGRNVPRVSITVDYEEAELAQDEGRS